MKRLKLVVAGGVVFALALWATGNLKLPIIMGDGEEAATKHLVNRAWVNRMPKHKRDVVSWVIPLKHKGKNFGVAQASSHYWFAGERFTYTLQGSDMKLFFQQSRKKATVKVKTWECKGKAPKPFDLCMEMSRGKKSAKFYSRKDWKVPRDADAESIEGLELPLLPPVPASIDACDDCTDGSPTILTELGL